MTRTEYETVIRTEGGGYLKQSSHRDRATAENALDETEKGGDFVDDHSLLVFHLRKGEDDEAGLMRCLPAYWTAVRNELGGPRAHEIKPVGYAVERGNLLVVCRCPENTLRAMITTQISRITRRATGDDYWRVDGTIPREVLNAVHLATWPEGPAAIDAIIKALDELEAKETSSNVNLDVRTGKPLASAIVRPEDVRRIVDARTSNRTTVAVHEPRTNATVRTRTETTSKTIAPASTATVPTRKDVMIHRLMHPESFKATVWHGIMSHGALTVIAYAFYMLDIASMDTTDSILAWSLLINMFLLPLIRRWGVPSMARVAPALSRMSPSLLKAANDGAPTVKAISAAPAAPSAASPPTAARADSDDEESDEAWETILSALERREDRNRVQEARAACDRLSSIANEQRGDVHSDAVFDTIRTTLPRLAEDLVRMIRHADEPERTETIARIVQATEHLARSADSARKTMVRAVQDRITTTITYIESKTESEDLSTIDHPRNAA